MLEDFIDFMHESNEAEQVKRLVCYLPKQNIIFVKSLLEVIKDNEVDLGSGYSYNLLTHKLYKGKDTIFLTEIEREIMDALVDAKGCIVPHNCLIKRLWGYSEDNSILRVNVNRLKRKIGNDIIKCNKGKGYYIQKEG